MKTKSNILTAFILNLIFSIFEFFGGIITGSVAIVSDAMHDLGDALSIFTAYILEKKSLKQPDEKYTYGYARYSVLAGAITTVILLVGSVLVTAGAITRIINPREINYDGMIVFAVVGMVVNSLAAFFTRSKDSINQKAVNLHMLEDVLGWIVVLIGAIIMRFTDIKLIDPILSIAVAVFIFINALKNFKEIIDIFLEKIPKDTDINEIKNHIMEIDGVCDVHHIHIRSIDGINHYATMHIVTDEEPKIIKNKIREELSEHGICHVTLELEKSDEKCGEKDCHIEFKNQEHHHGHHHH
ncbi:MAG: cation transporter [Clostridia bacterium]|nr:cation transporter [Clostridia bacterium]